MGTFHLMKGIQKEKALSWSDHQGQVQISLGVITTEASTETSDPDLGRGDKGQRTGKREGTGQGPEIGKEGQDQKIISTGRGHEKEGKDQRRGDIARGHETGNTGQGHRTGNTGQGQETGNIGQDHGTGNIGQDPGSVSNMTITVGESHLLNGISNERKLVFISSVMESDMNRLECIPNKY